MLIYSSGIRGVDKEGETTGKTKLCSPLSMLPFRLNIFQSSSLNAFSSSAGQMRDS